MTSTVRRKASEINKRWHVVDAADRPLGRVASEVAALLRGKHKPTYEPHLDDGDFVVIINAGKVRLSGRKAEQKVYYRHSGYPGNLRKRTFAEQMERRPERVLERSVWGMLPKGPLGKRMRRHLKVYAGADHPHQAQIVGSDRAAEVSAQAEADALQEMIENPPKPPRLRPLSVPETPTPRLTRREKVASWLVELEEARAVAAADAAAMADVEEEALPEEEEVSEAEAETVPQAEADSVPEAEAETDPKDEAEEN
ncbi:MAG TPA: 50S ribosomal protein L13 [Dehalococcoidia bacterium]|nr:50S ribosomal protein L13 [Dehalococcoidia bacterium]|tara:strand:+ start:636 stop:1400 length:765 start_codon:yes stop_codon:yes gene_type:complete